MRLRAVLGIGFLVLATAGAQEIDAPRVLTSIQIRGGDGDDRRFAEAALGLNPGQSVDGPGFQRALAAVRLVDRYRSVEGLIGTDGTAVVNLEPLVPLATWRWEGDAIPSTLRKSLLPELRKGQRMGPQRRAVLTEAVERRLREAGYPEGRILMALEQDGRNLRLTLVLGAPNLVREVRLEGDPAPYTREALLKIAGLRPGVTFWTPSIMLEAQRRLRQRLVKNHRLEGSVRLEPAGEVGVMLLEVRPGPRVTLRDKGLNMLAPIWGQPRLAEFVPLARAERYSSSILEEGAGRITTYFRNQGYPEVKVTYERVVTKGTAEHPEAVTVTYTVDYGPRRKLGKVQFEGNREASEEELRKAVALPKRFMVFSPFAEAEAIKALEDRLIAFYHQRGYAEVQVRRRVDTSPNGSVDVRLIIREGQRRFLNALVLDLPTEPGFSHQTLSKSLLLAFSDRAVPIAGTSRYRSDRRHLQSFEGTLESTPQGARLSFTPALPLVRNDLALVVSDLHQRLSSAGALNPQVKLAFEEDGSFPFTLGPGSRSDVLGRRIDLGPDIVVVRPVGCPNVVGSTP